MRLRFRGWCALVVALSGCARITTMAAGTPDGVTCTEWRAHHPLSSPTIWVMCRDERSALVTPYPFQSSNPLAPILSAASALPVP